MHRSGVVSMSTTIVPQKRCLIITCGYYTEYIEKQISTLMPHEIFLLVSREHDDKEQACAAHIEDFVGGTHDFHRVIVDKWTFEHVFGAVGQIVRDKRNEDCEVFVNISNGPREAIIPAVFATSMVGNERTRVIHTIRDKTSVRPEGFFRKIGGGEFDSVPIMPLRRLNHREREVIGAIYVNGGTVPSIRHLVEIVEDKQFPPHDNKYKAARTEMQRTLEGLGEWGAITKEKKGKEASVSLTPAGRGVARVYAEPTQ